jgi:hypothetical protein
MSISSAEYDYYVNSATKWLKRRHTCHFRCYTYNAGLKAEIELLARISKYASELEIENNDYGIRITNRKLYDRGTNLGFLKRIGLFFKL